MSERPIRLVCVDHLATQECGRGLYREIARQDDVDLTLVVPPLWRDNFRDIPVDPSMPDDPYHLEVLPLLFPGRSVRCLHWGLGRLLRRIRPHVVYTQSEPEDLLLAQIGLIRAIHRLAFKVIFRTARNIHYTRFGLPNRLGWLYGCVEYFGLRVGDYCFSQSAAGPEVLAARGFHATEVIPHFVDPAFFHPKDSRQLKRTLGLENFTVGCFGRLLPQKGVGLVLDAMAGLNAPVQLLLVGKGPARDGWMEQARRLRIDDSVVYKPSVLRSEMPDYICACDCVVLPSYTTPKWKEMFGRILIEAMACGVPLIGSDSGDIPRVIGEAGLIFPEKDSAALRHCIRRLIDDPELRVRLSALGRERAAREYSCEAVAAARLRAIRHLAGVDGAGSDDALNDHA